MKNPYPNLGGPGLRGPGLRGPGLQGPGLRRQPDDDQAQTQLLAYPMGIHTHETPNQTNGQQAGDKKQPAFLNAPRVRVKADSYHLRCCSQARTRYRRCRAPAVLGGLLCQQHCGSTPRIANKAEARAQLFRDLVADLRRGAALSWRRIPAGIAAEELIHGLEKANDRFGGSGRYDPPAWLVRIHRIGLSASLEPRPKQPDSALLRT